MKFYIFFFKIKVQMEYFNLLLNDSAPILGSSWESNCTFCCFADSHGGLFSCVFLILEFEPMLIKALRQKFHILLPVSIGLPEPTYTWRREHPAHGTQHSELLMRIYRNWKLCALFVGMKNDGATAKKCAGSPKN